MKRNQFIQGILLFLLVGLITFNCFAEDISEIQEDESDSEIEQLLDNQTITKPSFVGKILGEQWFRNINQDSRLNPDNEISDYNETKRTLEVQLELSDFLDQEESFRWLSKLKAFKTYEHDNNDDGTIKFDELFVDWNGDEWFVNLGKRRNNWGPALAFNPVNVVVPARDPLDPNQESEGHPMLMLNYGGEMLTWELILTRDYDNDWFSEYNRWGMRFGFMFDEVELGLFYFDGEKNKADEEYNQMLGASYSSNFLDNATLYIEAATFKNNERNYYDEFGAIQIKDEAVYKIAIGSSITIDGNTSLLLEAFHNSGGYSKSERENFYKTVDRIVTPYPDISQFGIFEDKKFGEMNRNYLLISFSQSEIYEKYGYKIQTLGTEDGSASSEISGSYAISDFYLFTISFNYYSGDENSEFGNSESESDLIASLSCSF